MSQCYICRKIAQKRSKQIRALCIVCYVVFPFF